MFLRITYLVEISFFWIAEKLDVFRTLSRNSLPEMFCKKGGLIHFAKLTGKRMCQSLFFNKVAGLRTATSLKKRRSYKCFPVSFAQFQTTPFCLKLQQQDFTHPHKIDDEYLKSYSYKWKFFGLMRKDFWERELNEEWLFKVKSRSLYFFVFAP